MYDVNREELLRDKNTLINKLNFNAFFFYFSFVRLIIGHKAQFHILWFINFNFIHNSGFCGIRFNSFKCNCHLAFKISDYTFGMFHVVLHESPGRPYRRESMQISVNASRFDLRTFVCFISSGISLSYISRLQQLDCDGDVWIGLSVVEVFIRSFVWSNIIEKQQKNNM